MKKYLLILLFLLSCSTPSANQKQKAELAESLFAKGDLEQSFKLYQELEQSGVSNTLIYERLAETSKDNALATYYLRKALIVDPGCESCNERLANLRSEIKFSPMLRELPLLPPKLRPFLLIGISLLFSAWVLSFQLIPRQIFLLGLAPLAIATFWILAGTHCGTDFPPQIETCLLKGKKHKEQEAIVIAENSFALSSKDRHSQAVLELPKGSEILVDLIQENWALVRLPNNRAGWISIKRLKFIN